jgi:NAD(P)-dependent dehydrogenase (short-subunit alcohol dehydrogenase family)
VVLVTGGSRGIGKAISKGFAQRGDQVIINYHTNKAAAEETLSQLSGEGHSIAQCDVSDSEACLRMVDQVSSRYGRLDVLVNNAAIYSEASPLSTSFEDWKACWEKHMALNVMGPACLSWCAANLMSQTGGGAIVSVSSRGAKRGEPLAPAYGASKAALNSMCQSLASALGGSGISVTAVAPGFTETEMAASVLASPRGDEVRSQSPFNRVAQPEEVARVVMFLASEKSKWLSGSVVDCNGASYFH